LIRFQSGSIWATLLGNPDVIKLLIAAISGTAILFLNRVTTDGKLKRVVKNAEAVKAVQAAIREVAGGGVDVSEANRQQSRNSAAIAKALGQLLEGETELRVNDQSITPTIEAMKALPRRPRRLLASPKVERSDESIEPYKDEKDGTGPNDEATLVDG
jgi:hypothetical protein